MTRFTGQTDGAKRWNEQQETDRAKRDAELLEHFERSGLSIRQYAAKHLPSISAARLHQRLQRARSDRAAAQP